MKFSLRRDHNAIAEFVAILDFFAPPPPEIIAEIQMELAGIKVELDLPAPISVQVFNINFGGNSIPPPLPQFAPLGFQRYAPTGEQEESIQIQGASLVYTTTNYTRWVLVKGRLMAAISRLARIYAKAVPAITALRLQYINEFFCPNVENGDATEVFRQKNKYLTPVSREVHDSWHSHTGFFTRISDIERELVNVNADFIGSTTGSKLSVLILGGVYYNTPGQAPLAVSVDDMDGVLDERFERAHTIEKEVVREVFSDDYLRAMGDIDVDQ